MSELLDTYGIFGFHIHCGNLDLSLRELLEGYLGSWYAWLPYPPPSPRAIELIRSSEYHVHTIQKKCLDVASVIRVTPAVLYKAVSLCGPNKPHNRESYYARPRATGLITDRYRVSTVIWAVTGLLRLCSYCEVFLRVIRGY